MNFLPSFSSTARPSAPYFPFFTSLAIAAPMSVANPIILLWADGLSLSERLTFSKLATLSLTNLSKLVYLIDPKTHAGLISWTSLVFGAFSKRTFSSLAESGAVGAIPASAMASLAACCALGPQSLSVVPSLVPSTEYPASWRSLPQCATWAANLVGLVSGVTPIPVSHLALAGARRASGDTCVISFGTILSS